MDFLTRFYQQFVTFLPQFVTGLVVFLIFWLAGSVVKSIIMRLAGKSNHSRQYVFSLVSQITKFTFVIIGAVSALGTMGINVAALVAGLGLTGFAVGFALKDALSNILAGIMILIFQPFHQGDNIIVTGYQGIVLKIDLRYTTLKGEGKDILIPNASMLTNVVTVMTA